MKQMIRSFERWTQEMQIYDKIMALDAVFISGAVAGDIVSVTLSKLFADWYQLTQIHDKAA